MDPAPSDRIAPVFLSLHSHRIVSFAETEQMMCYQESGKKSFPVSLIDVLR